MYKFIAVAIIFFVVGTLFGFILSVLMTASGRYHDAEDKAKITSSTKDEVKR